MYRPIASTLAFLTWTTLCVPPAGAAGREAPSSPPPPAARDVSVRGEVVSLDCYLAEGHRGEAHRPCALAALSHGGSLAIVEDDSGELLPLADRTPATSPNRLVRELVAQRVLATGRLYERARGRVLVLESVERLGD